MLFDLYVDFEYYPSLCGATKISELLYASANVLGVDFLRPFEDCWVKQRTPEGTAILPSG